MTAATGMQAVRLQVMWNRLISVVEEQAQTLVRTSFSTSVREAGDVSAGVFDTEGRMLAQAVTGTPGHINSMAASVRHFLDAFPAAGMREGDVYLTNDPWKGTGHLHDFTMVTPAFRKGSLVALFAATSHVVDVGGLGLSPDSRQIYHEGIYVPLMPLVEEGRMNEWLLRLIRQNVREPVQVEGDIYALVACNERGAVRLLAMMDEYGLDDIEELGRLIIRQSRQGMAEAIGRLPRGTWRHAMRIDGFEAPIDLVCAVSIEADEIRVDWSGSSGVSSYGINCPLCYTDAYTSFGVKCAVAPAIPNNAGSLAAIRVSAPENSIVNAPHPCAVVARATIGHMLPDVVFGCLDQAVPGWVPAEGTSNLWNIRLAAGHGITGRVGDAFTPFAVTSFHSGGAGARPRQDGLSATPFPSGVRNVPVEITEAITPIVFWRKDLRVDSGGPGRERGGLGQTVVLGSRENAPYGIHAVFERVVYPPRGRDGGASGAKGRVSFGSGAALRPKGFQVVPAGERLVIEMPGGGGIGDPAARDPDRVAADVALGLVSVEAARRDYKVAVTAAGVVDAEATEVLRGKA
jgi:N-methylhydantoinase B